MSVPQYFQTRLTRDPRRRVLWSALFRYYFAQFIHPGDCVIDLGCGYGEFISSAVARRRIGIDVRPDLAQYLAEGVECRIASVADLSFLDERSVDVAMASNLFEHLSQDLFRQVLSELRRVLAPTGTLFIIQPNYYYAYRQYFDDYTHVAVYSHVSLCDFLRASQYVVTECVPRFLPLSLKSRWPVLPILIRAYLASPWKPFAGQMLVRCQPA